MDPELAAAWALLAGRRVVVLTGAGVSTDSGIPDYRGPDAPPRRPMTYQDFVSGPVAQRRYWVRSHVGWRHLRAASPNDGHRALARLEARGLVHALVTQNVDGLHQGAGSVAVVDLHGRIRDVVCLDCGARSARAALHERLELLNPGFAPTAVVEVAPDGDAAVGSDDGFVVAACEPCGGRLKPDVVFFGENVPKPRVAWCYDRVDEAEALLVAGSSLTVMSGLRFVRHAAKRGIPVVLVNRGPTRGDPLATVTLDRGCSETLSAFAAAAAGSDAGSDAA